MPLIDYTKETSFCDSAEDVSIIVQHSLVKLRNHAKFDEEIDPAILHAAGNLSAILEDAHLEIEQLIGMIEKAG